jgi:hypothetical protein
MVIKHFSAKKQSPEPVESISDEYDQTVDIQIVFLKFPNKRNPSFTPKP